MSKIIPNISNLIKKKLHELHLKPEVSPLAFLDKVKDKKHRYFSPCTTILGHEIAFYARLHDNNDAKMKFINEISILSEIRHGNLPIKKVVPQIYNYGIEKNFEWFIREYPKATPLGHSRQLQKTVSKKIIPSLVKNIIEISKIPASSLDIRIKKFDPKNYLIKDHCLGLVSKKLIDTTLCQDIIRLTEKSFHLIRSENSSVSHGDLNLGNILTDRQKIWIIDWELCHLNNFVYDIGYLWAHLWQAPRPFRQLMMKRYIHALSPIKRTRFKKILPIVVAYLCMGGIPFRKTKNEKLTVLQKRRRYYVQLLRNCLQSFHTLINT